MIQRIQSLWLLLAAALNPLMLLTPMPERMAADPAEWIYWAPMSMVALASFALLVAIFSFKKPSLQLQIVRIGTLSLAGVFAFEVAILFSLGGIGPYLWDEAISAAITGSSLVLAFLGRRAIQMDQALLASVDRLR
ncbi:MAG: DUF4293 family protein [Balneolaceae bacterium]|nr:DUF4293 family protein [Balneolaceae bacterium]MDR9446857.1 DUF4293 family protein [Balneolaceae bacterium]